MLAGMASPFPKERYPIYAEAQRLIAEDLPYISLWYKKSYAVLRNGLDGFTVTPTGDFFYLKDVHDDASLDR